MTTRVSTPKYQTYHVDSRIVVLSGVSRTEAKQFARSMDTGSQKKRFAVRAIPKANTQEVQN